ncbi:MAG: hypothetical protein K5755_05990 [Clostridiales bacterium]|nr:hypothetical protein [Clostridiales bacterium]
MKFGIDLRNKRTGADIAVIIFQLVSVLPTFYVFVASGYIAILNKRNALTALFDFGICALPRWETLLLSFLYRLFSSEMAPYFVMLLIALALGVASKRVLTGSVKKSMAFHIVFSVFIVADLIIRILPFGFNSQFTLAFNLGAAAVRAVCLALLIADMVAYKRSANTDSAS